MGYTIGNVREAQELCPLTQSEIWYLHTKEGGASGQVWNSVLSLGGWVGGRGTREHLHVKWKVGVPDRLA